MRRCLLWMPANSTTVRCTAAFHCLGPSVLVLHSSGASRSRRLARIRRIPLSNVELTGRRRRGALAARRKMKQGAARPGCHAVGAPVERHVRPRLLLNQGHGTLRFALVLRGECAPTGGRYGRDKGVFLLAVRVLATAHCGQRYLHVARSHECFGCAELVWCEQPEGELGGGDTAEEFKFIHVRFRCPPSSWTVVSSAELTRDREVVLIPAWLGLGDRPELQAERHAGRICGV